MSIRTPFLALCLLATTLTARGQTTFPLANYAWKCTVRLVSQGRESGTLVYLVTSDERGQAYATFITSQSAGRGGQGGGGSMGMQGMGRGRGGGGGGGQSSRGGQSHEPLPREWMEKVQQFVAAYQTPSHSQLAAFMKTAQSEPIKDSQPPQIEAWGPGLVDHGDEVTLQLEPTTLMVHHLEGRTSYQGDPLDLKVEYTQVGQAWVPERTTAHSGKEHLELIVENSNFKKQQPPQPSPSP